MKFKKKSIYKVAENYYDFTNRLFSTFYLSKSEMNIGELLDKKDEKNLPIWINPIILNDRWEILLQLRPQAYSYKWWTRGLPWWKLQKYETFEKALIREVKEETNLDVNPQDCQVINIGNTFDRESKTHFIQIWMLVKKTTGELKIMEPSKCEELRYFPLDWLPNNLFPPTETNIKLFISWKFYDILVNSK